MAMAALAAAAATQQAKAVDLADPFHCAVVKDGAGNPLYTVCVPGL
jgi:hypothetical protein